MNSNNDIKITNNGTAAVRNTNGNVKIDAGGNTIIEGDIKNIGPANIDVAFNGNGSSLTGAVIDGDGKTTITMNDGATWNVAGDSGVDALVMDNANINIKSGMDVVVADASGNGNVKMEVAEDLGSLTTGESSTASLNVTATDASGKELNADDVSISQLKTIKNQVTGGAKVTASAAEGLVNGAISIDNSGNTTITKNRVMDSALELASITSVSLDRILTNDVRKRMGDLRSANGEHGVWMRWDGGRLKGDSGLTNDFNTIQIGADTSCWNGLHVGAAASFTYGDGDHARGSSEMEGFTFAGYGTWMAENGFFADVVARIGSFENDMNVEGQKGTIDSIVASLSTEIGKRFTIYDRFYLEPQVELSYTYVDGDKFSLGQARYDIDNTDSVIGRLGFAAGWYLPDDMGNVYARASVVQQFMGDAKISGTINGVYNVQEIDGDDTWFEYGVGTNVKLTDNTYVWADVERTEGATIDEEWRGTVGVRFSF